MRVSRVVITGRPNVGKSSLFNWLARERLAIVDDTPGVTRDRLSHLLVHDEKYLELIDTGGMGIDDVDDLTEDVERQIDAGINSADLILFVVDARDGLLPLDQRVAQRLRRVGKPVICVANKTDSPCQDAEADQFRSLGFSPLIRASTKANRNREPLLDAIVGHLPADGLSGPPLEEPVMRVAIVGRRNVGKSTFVNALARDERMIVSEVPGTTRDSVDVRFELDGKTFIAIDTPGLRRSKSVRTDVDFYGARRAERSVRRADVVLMFFDAEDRIGKVDKQLCAYVGEHYKPCIFVVNKWDLLRGRAATEDWANYLHDTFRTMGHVPVAFITGRTGKNVKLLINHAQMLFKQSRQRITTGQLNGLVEKALAGHPPPLFRRRRPKIYYATQVGIQPPTIVLVCNEPAAFNSEYRRYLLGVLRDELPFAEVPIRLCFRKHGQTVG